MLIGRRVFPGRWYTTWLIAPPTIIRSYCLYQMQTRLPISGAFDSWNLGSNIQSLSQLWTKELGDLKGNMTQFKGGSMHWNTTVFQNIFRWKQVCKARLLGIQRILADQPRHSLSKLEKKLLVEFDNILVRRRLNGSRKPERNGCVRVKGSQGIFMLQSWNGVGGIKSCNLKVQTEGGVQT